MYFVARNPVNRARDWNAGSSGPARGPVVPQSGVRHFRLSVGGAPRHAHALNPAASARRERPSPMTDDLPLAAPASETARRIRAAFRRGYRALRKPAVRALRDLAWYRGLTRLPRNETVSPREAADASGGRFTVVHPARAVELPSTPAEVVPERFAAVRSFHGPPTFVAELRGARLYGRAVAVIAADDRVVTDVTVHLKGRLEDHNVMGRLSLPHRSRLDGTTAVLSAPGGNTYFHWLFDVLPRLEILRLAGYDVATVDRNAVNSTRHGFQRETLARLGVAEERVLSSDRV